MSCAVFDNKQLRTRFARVRWNVDAPWDEWRQWG